MIMVPMSTTRYSVEHVGKDDLQVMQEVVHHITLS